MTDEGLSPSAEAKPRHPDWIDVEAPEWDIVGVGQGFWLARLFGEGPIYQVNAYTGAVQEIREA